jgi:phage terminase large subunit
VEQTTKPRDNSIIKLPDGWTWQPQPKQAQCLDACGLLWLYEGVEASPLITENYGVEGDLLTGYREMGVIGDSLHRQAVAELLGYGGAAGGAKTDAGVAIPILADAAYPGCTIGFFRRKFPELDGAEGAIERSRQLYTGLPNVQHNEVKHRWRLPNGSMLHFCNCQYEHDRFQYQSQQFDIILVDEATHFTWVIVDYLLTRNRATVEGIIPFTLLSTNPGNVGHVWFKSLFVDSGQPDVPHEAANPNGAKCSVIFIPARLEDNVILRRRDPAYEGKLESRGADTVRALRYGDWEIAAGLYFSEHWRSVEINGKPSHVIPTMQEIPDDWVLYGSIDYGFHARNEYEKPFSYGLYAVGRLEPGGVPHTFRIDELAAAHWDVEKQKEEIEKLESRYKQRVRYRVACKSMYTKRKEFGPTIAEEYADVNIAGISLPVIKPNSDRENGWERCRLYLNDAPDGLPHFMSFDRCKHFNTVIPSLPKDDKHPDDVDPDAEDHCAEEWRHFLMSRPQPAAVKIDESLPVGRSRSVIAERERMAYGVRETEEYL